MYPAINNFDTEFVQNAKNKIISLQKSSIVRTRKVISEQPNLHSKQQSAYNFCWPKELKNNLETMKYQGLLFLI